MASWAEDTRRFLEAHRLGHLATAGARRRAARRPGLLCARRRRRSTSSPTRSRSAGRPRELAAPAEPAREPARGARGRRLGRGLDAARVGARPRPGDRSSTTPRAHAAALVAAARALSAVPRDGARRSGGAPIVRIVPVRVRHWRAAPAHVRTRRGASFLGRALSRSRPRAALHRATLVVRRCSTFESPAGLQRRDFPGTSPSSHGRCSASARALQRRLRTVPRPRRQPVENRRETRDAVARRLARPARCLAGPRAPSPHALRWHRFRLVHRQRVTPT